MSCEIDSDPPPQQELVWDPDLEMWRIPNVTTTWNDAPAELDDDPAAEPDSPVSHYQSLGSHGLS